MASPYPTDKIYICGHGWQNPQFSDFLPAPLESLSLQNHNLTGASVMGNFLQLLKIISLSLIPELPHIFLLFHLLYFFSVTITLFFLKACLSNPN